MALLVNILMYFIEHHVASHSLTDLTENVTYVHLMTNHRIWRVLVEKMVALLVHVLIVSWFNSCRSLRQVFPIPSSSHDLSPELYSVILMLHSIAVLFTDSLVESHTTFNYWSLC